jgi:hypothetical protein
MSCVRAPEAKRIALRPARGYGGPALAAAPGGPMEGRSAEGPEPMVPAAARAVPADRKARP